MKDTAEVRSLLPRPADLAALFEAVRDMRCMSIVGISNTGKSALLRSLTDAAVQRAHLGADAAGYLFVYIDFNQMLEMTEQAFYELILRCMLDALRTATAGPEVLRSVEEAYQGLVAPASHFEVPLRFAQAMTAVGDLLPQRAVFLMDELDGPVAGIDGRVFLNLRALKDRHRQGLTYVTATNRRLSQIRLDADASEFCELFAHRTYYIAPLGPEEIDDFVQRFAAREDVTFSDEDVAFVRNWSGGHPGLLEATCRVLGLLTGRPVRDPSQNWIIHRRAAEMLVQEINIQAECRKIWTDLTPAEQDTLVAIRRRSRDGQERGSPDAGAQPASSGDPLPDLESVVAKHLVVESGSEHRIFARAFEEFVARQNAAKRADHDGLAVDPDSGEVWVEGVKAPTLTNLEYRLLLLLYGRLGKICTKYEVVEAVWGEDYLDEVDDARIEKLVSRLRQKVEPDPANPRFVLTIRGRGYKLAEA